jgi:hypothetical protein
MWDGMVSGLRTYSVKEMRDMVNQIENHQLYIWKLDKVKSGPSVITYLLGYKKQEST